MLEVGCVMKMEKFIKIEKRALYEQQVNYAKEKGLTLAIIKNCPLSQKCLCFKGIKCSKIEECFEIHKDKRKPKHITTKNLKEFKPSDEKFSVQRR